MSRCVRSILAFAVAALVLLGPASAQQAVKIHRIGYLTISPRETQSHLIAAFERGLADRGYTVGRDILIEYRFADGKLDRLQGLADDLVRAKVDLIVTGVNPNVRAAQRATSSIPIVAANVYLPVEERFVQSLIRPGGNITGLSTDAADAVIGFGAVTLANRRSIIRLAAQARIPTIFTDKQYVDDGALMSYGPDLTDLFRRAAGYVDRVLKGAKPADLPVEQPTRYVLALNQKTARTLGIAFPQQLLLQADHVVE